MWVCFFLLSKYVKFACVIWRVQTTVISVVWKHLLWFTFPIFTRSVYLRFHLSRTLTRVKAIGTNLHQSHLLRDVFGDSQSPLRTFWSCCSCAPRVTLVVFPKIIRTDNTESSRSHREMLRGLNANPSAWRFLSPEALASYKDKKATKAYTRTNLSSKEVCLLEMCFWTILLKVRV